MIRHYDSPTQQSTAIGDGGNYPLSIGRNMRKYISLQLGTTQMAAMNATDLAFHQKLENKTNQLYMFYQNREKWFVN